MFARLKFRAILWLDGLFLAGFALASFLGGKATILFVVTGLLPIPWLLVDRGLQTLRVPLWRLVGPSGLYFGYSLITYFFFTGLTPGEKHPVNPDLELYGIAIALLVAGTLRGLLTEQISRLFLQITPWALLASFAVLATLFLIGLRDGCQRVQGFAAWPFIPALIFSTLSFLTLLGWPDKDRNARFFCLTLLSLSVVVVVSLTASRGNAVALFATFGAFLLLSVLPRFKGSLPSWKQLGAACAIGVLLAGSINFATGCGARMISVFSVISLLHPGSSESSSISPIGAANAATADTGSQSVSGQKQTENLPQQPSPSSATFDDIKHADMSAGERFEMWTTAIKSIREAPLLGHGSLYLQHLITERYGYEHNHNQYLSWLVTGGVLGLGIGLLFLSLPWFISAGLALPDRLIITLSISLVWGASMVFDSYFNLKFYTHYYCMLIGLLYAVVNDMIAKTESHP